MPPLSPPRLPEIAPGERIRLATPVLAVIDGLAGAPIAPEFAAALAPLRIVRTRMLVRHKPGFDLLPAGAAAHPDALREAARALLASLPEHDVLVVEGPALLAALEVRLAVLGARSPSLASLDPDVRGLRERFDLVLYDARPRAIALVAQAVTSRP